MTIVPVDGILLDEDGRLHVIPRLPASWITDFEGIYRAARSVRWNRDRRSLYVLPVPYFSELDELRQIAKAVADECGGVLAFTNEARLVNIPPSLAAEFRLLARSPGPPEP